MEQRAEIEFPVEWTFRIIAEASAKAADMELSQVFHKFNMAPELKEGKASAGGKYRTVQASVVIPDRMVFDALPEALSKISGVRMVL